MGRTSKPNPYRSLPVTDAAKVFGVARKVMYDWTDAGCPKNPDGTIDTAAAFQWYVEKECERRSTGGLKDRKIELECERLQAQISNLKNETVARSFHEQVLISRASSLRAFLEKTALSAAVEFVGLNLDQVRTRLFNLFRRAMNEYADAGIDPAQLEKEKAEEVGDD